MWVSPPSGIYPSAEERLKKKEDQYNALLSLSCEFWDRIKTTESVLRRLRHPCVTNREVEEKRLIVRMYSRMECVIPVPLDRKELDKVGKKIYQKLIGGVA